MHTLLTILKNRTGGLLFITLFILSLAQTTPLTAQTQNTPKLPGIHEAMQKFIDAGDIAGAETLVVTKDKTLHTDVAGLANMESKEPMQANTLFWIASMTKPVTAVSVLMLQDQGKLNVNDPVSKYIRAFANLKTPSGKLANLTIKQILTHTSGLGEADDKDILNAKTLADLIPLFLAAPMQYEPGSKWKYTQSGINVAAHIVEITSGMSFNKFVQKMVFDPLGMTSSTFYPDKNPNRAIGYTKNKSTGKLEPTPLPAIYSGKENQPPLGNGGIYSTGPDYARFCQMLLGNGVYNGKRYLSNEAMKLLTTIQTGDLPAGFISNHGADYGWGIGVCIQRRPHDGVGSMLSAGTFGHGGAWGTQAWIDPVRGVAYIIMVQRPGINGDESELRRMFQQAAADALIKNN
ncbi:MAG: serine hydrolase domain-containing protein [Chitinophagaceae bacterium]